MNIFTKITIYCLIIFIVSSTIYTVENYYFYYYSKEQYKINELSETKKQINYILNDNSGNLKLSENKLNNYINNRFHEIKIRVYEKTKLIAEIKNNYVMRNDRTIIEDKIELAYGDLNYIIFLYADIRPPLITHLGRAWTFSAFDYINNPDDYKNNNLIMRSLPLLTSVLMTFVILYVFLLYFSSSLKRKEAEYKLHVKNVEGKLVKRIRYIENQKNIGLKDLNDQFEIEREYLYNEVEKLTTELKNKSQIINGIEVIRNENKIKNSIEIEYLAYKEKNKKIIEGLKFIIVSKEIELKKINSCLEEVKLKQNNNDELNDLRKILNETNVRNLNDFELEVSSHIDNEVITKYKNFKQYIDYDISFSNSEPQTADMIIAGKHCIYVIEAKGYYSSNIYCDGDHKNDNWSYRKNGKIGHVASCHGNNPYRQAKTYSNNILSRISSAKVGKPPIVSVVIFPDCTEIEGIGVATRFGAFQIQQFSFVINKSKIKSLVDFLELKYSKYNYNSVEAYKCAEMIL